MIIDFRKNRTRPNSIVIKGVEAERVSTYKYLGVVFDSSLNWKENTNTIIQKAYSCIQCLRKLRSFDIRPDFFSFCFCFLLLLLLLLLYCC